MSKYSGKCDLFDYIGGMGGHFDENGKPVKFGDENVHCYYSDELLDFEAFKKQTKGVIHQHKLVEVNEYNQEYVKKHCREFDFKALPKKANERKTRYTYTYWNKEYTLKELNKQGVYITIDIHFDTLLDLIPYYPYIITMACGGEVYISNRSFVDKEEDSFIKSGIESDFGEYYKKQLQEHYLEVCKEYFLPELDARTEIVPIEKKNLLKHFDGSYTLHVPFKVDYMHNIEYSFYDGQNHSHWTSPKFLTETNILLSKEDVENYLKDYIKEDKVRIRCVRKREIK